MTIRYSDQLADMTEAHLGRFFEGWPSAPNPKTHLKILRNSYAVWLALDDSQNGQCVGFINAISDGVFYAYIPLLEVLPTHQGLGIGKTLLQRMTQTLTSMYAIDVVCDDSVAPFYEAQAFHRCVGMVRRNYTHQSGEGS